jgi:hypothetical protein
MRSRETSGEHAQRTVRSTCSSLSSTTISSCDFVMRSADIRRELRLRSLALVGADSVILLFCTGDRGARVRKTKTSCRSLQYKALLYCLFFSVGGAASGLCTFDSLLHCNSTIKIIISVC